MMEMEKKFKLTGDLAIRVINAPAEFPVVSTKTAPFDRILAFVYSIEEMADVVRQIIQEDQLQEGAYLFLLYPKKGNKQFDSYIGRDDIFPAFDMDEEKYVFGSPIKFASLQSLDETYSILSLKKQTKKTKRTAASQRVGDYVADIPKLTAYLADQKEGLALFESLTPGYQKDWARYVFSAKREETQQQRLAEMAQLLSQGYKTKEHFRKAQK